VTPASQLLATILQYGRLPVTHNSPGWVGFTIPADVIDEIEKVLADELELETALASL